jgi:hypothetical protein
MAPVVHQNVQPEPRQDNGTVESRQATRERPPQLNETVAGHRNGGAMNVLIDEDGTDSEGKCRS